MESTEILPLSLIDSPGMENVGQFFRRPSMNPAQAEHGTTAVGTLCNRLDGIASLLNAVASGDGVESNARTCLEFAIQSIHAVGEDLAAVGAGTADGLAEQSFRESRAQEARSEVDSGEFDVHG